MTLDELRALDTATISAEQAASVLNCNAQVIRIQARQHPEQLGFPVIVLGKRMKIPRLPFIECLTGRPAAQ